MYCHADCDQIAARFAKMDFKNHQNGNHHIQGHATHVSYTSPSTQASGHHSKYPGQNIHNSKQSPQKTKFRRRCRSECLSPVLGGQHIERYNLQHKQYISKSSSYYPSADSFAAVNYDDWRPPKPEGESPPHSRDRDHKENQLQNGHRAPITDLRDIYGQQEYKKKLRHHQNFQVDGVKSVQYERQIHPSRLYSEAPLPKDAGDLYRDNYKSSYSELERHRYRARSEPEPQDFYYHDSHYDNGLKRSRDVMSPEIEVNRHQSKSSGRHQPNRHSVLVNNHFNRLSPKLKPRSPVLSSYRTKLVKLRPTTPQISSGNSRHKSLSPTMLKSASSSTTTSNNSNSNSSNTFNTMDNDSQEEDERTLVDDEGSESEEYSEGEPDIFVGCDSGVLDDDITDSEDNYQNTMALTESSLANQTNAPAVTGSVQGCFVDDAPIAASLFPFVPPYITFATHEYRQDMPACVNKALKWKLTTITPIVVRKILFNTGFRLIKKTSDWIGTWGKHMKSPCFKTLRSYQKFNHLPGSFQIGRKDRCWRNLQGQMSKHGKKEFGFMPRTFIIPQDTKLLRQVWQRYSQKNVKWIIKPPASARGTGIKVVNRWNQIPKRKPLIVQRYIERPLLINGSKFDLRLYVLVTSINPLRVYMHTDGLARFASVKYSEKNETLNDRYMHLTNYSINKLSTNYDKNEDANACKGHKWTIKSLLAYFEEQGINTNLLWGALRNLVLRTILAGEGPINAMSKINMGSKYNAYELFGIDVLLDSELVPWLLEVNISPSLHSASPLDLAVKGPLVTALLNTVLFQIPPKIPLTQQNEVLRQYQLKAPLCYDKRIFVNGLSKEERHKHNQYTQKLTNREDYLSSILDHLTPDDVRCLIIGEDELNRCAPLERIFPVPNSHRFLPFTETPRYYNHLLDAWEHRYSNCRDNGIALLKSLCWKRVHLKVPPTTMQKDCNGKILSSISEVCPLEQDLQNFEDQMPKLIEQPEIDEHVEEETETDYIPKKLSPRRPSSTEENIVNNGEISN